MTNCTKTDLLMGLVKGFLSESYMGCGRRIESVYTVRIGLLSLI